MSADGAVLKDDRVYLAFDRFVCSEVRCCGMTALYTGRTIGGADVSVVTTDDVEAWEQDVHVSLDCECGRLRATRVAGADGAALTVVR